MTAQLVEQPCDCRSGWKHEPDCVNVTGDLPRKCRVVSCTNVGGLRVVAVIGGEEVELFFCAPHHAEYRAEEVRP